MTSSSSSKSVVLVDRRHSSGMAEASSVVGIERLSIGAAGLMSLSSGRVGDGYSCINSVTCEATPSSTFLAFARAALIASGLGGRREGSMISGIKGS